MINCFGDFGRSSDLKKKVNERRVNRRKSQMDIIKSIEQESLRSDVPQFNVGDTVRVLFKVIEGNKERIQAYEGVVISRKHGGLRETFTVRRISSGIGVERAFPIHSPKIEKVIVVRQGKVRRAKLYYLRERTGKSAKIKDRI
jgi:large subunit ribosomal protein L19